MDGVRWVEVAYLIAAIVPSIILHEVSHGVVALYFGDDTARRAGRLTLNPVRHVDPFGTLLLPAILALSGLGAFGYAKPVPVNVRRLRNPRQHSLYVSVAGPITNLAIAAVALVGFRMTRPELVRFVDDLPVVPHLFFYIGFVNVILAVFNLLPIPPLDGSAFIERVLPHTWWPTWLRFRQWGFGVLLLIIFVIPGALNRIFDPVLELWFELLV
ncbi:MAG TPA: site-2 protease family protein [Acidimicrobiales bacterium]|nr:site-2 protease family protein [Acidimicrobiales bacterium]